MSTQQKISKRNLEQIIDKGKENGSKEKRTVFMLGCFGNVIAGLEEPI